MGYLKKPAYGVVKAPSCEFQTVVRTAVSLPSWTILCPAEVLLWGRIPLALLCIIAGVSYNSRLLGSKYECLYFCSAAESEITFCFG